MKVQGEGFKFFVDGESKTVEETKSLIHDNMTITIKGLDVFYFSPKKEIKSLKNSQLELIEELEAKTEKRIRLANNLKEACIKRFDLETPTLKTEKLLKEAEEHQKQNGGVLQGVEFPFDNVKQNHFVTIPFGNNGTGGVKVLSNNNLDTRLNILQDKFKKAIDNSVLDGDFSKKQPQSYKETEGKLFYELDFKFIKQMAERMQSNKDNSKYDLWNWKRPMTPKGIEELKQATLRHLIEILEGNYEDDGRKFGHLEAVSNNIMMINYQLNNE